MLLFSIFYLFVKGKEKYYQQKNCESLVNNVQSEFINIALTKSNIINNSIEIEKRLYIINNDILAIRKNCKNNNILENKLIAIQDSIIKIQIMLRKLNIINY